MQEFNDKTAPHQLSLDAFGVQMRICTNSPELLQRIEPMIPRGWQRRTRTSGQQRLGLLDEGNDLYSMYRDDGICIHDGPGLEYALLMLDEQIHGHVALDAPEFIFLHAGVVADGHRAILIPGGSFSGKSTLVRALVETGAVYYSDEFAVLDSEGLVHAYGNRLSHRDPYGPPVVYHPEELGGVGGDRPVPVGLVVATRYRPNAKWDPERLSAGAAALALFEHAIPAQERPEQTLRYITNAISGATVLQGERGEANELAEVLLDALRAAA